MSFEQIVIIIYLIAGYWAVGQTVYANKIVIYTGNALFVQNIKLATFSAVCLG